MNFEINVQFSLQESGNGFQIMLLKKEFDKTNDYGPLNGVRKNFNGVGVFIYKSERVKPGQWVSQF